MGRKSGHQVFSCTVLYILSFGIPACIMLAILYQGGFYPFGDKTLFVMDMRDQYLEFFAYLRNMTAGDNSVFFCWSRSMGGNFLGLFAYYLASPLSFLANLFPVEKMHEAILLLTVLKIGLCGLSFAVYGNYLWRRRAETGMKSALAVLLFSTSYALISYNMVYSLCLMWLDGVILLPVVLLGTEKMLDGKKGLHYMLSLTVLFVCNYYIGFMAGIFTAVYFLYRAVCRAGPNAGKSMVLTGARFGVCTVLAAGLAAPLLLPAAYDLMRGKLAGGGSYRFSLEPDFDMGSFLGKFRNGVYDSITDSGLPAVYCGMAALVLAAVFFVCRGISLREKAGALTVLAFLTASFYYRGLNLAWHGFRAPVWFPYRYAFVFSFFLIYLGFQGVCALTAREYILDFGKKKRIERVRYVVLAMLLLLTVLDMKSNGQKLTEGLEEEFRYVRTAEYQAVVDQTKPLADRIKQMDDGLYRINAVYEYSKNDAMLFGYNGMTHYSSTYNAEVNSLTGKLGIAQAHIWNSGYGSTPLSDSLFGVSYRLSDRYEPPCYEKLADEGKGAAAYRNPLALPIAYAAGAGEPEPALGENPYANQNMLISAVAGAEVSCFEELEYVYEETETGWTYTLTAESEDPLYLYMYPADSGRADIYVNDVKYGCYFTTESTCSLYIGSYKPGQQVIVRAERIWRNPSARGAVIARLNMDRLESVLTQLQAGGMRITSHKGGTINGTISLQEGQMIMTSIPYDEGWTVWVDGRKAELQKFAGTFLAVAAPKGEHEIRFAYVSPGFYKGLGIFFLAAAAAVIYFKGWAAWGLSGAGKVRVKKETIS